SVVPGTASAAARAMGASSGGGIHLGQQSAFERIKRGGRSDWRRFAVINCGDCARALNPYLDRELTDEDVIQVRYHLDACVGCLDLYRFEESLRRLVRVRCQEQSA